MRYALSIIRPGLSHHGSTYWTKIDADSPAEAVDIYINQDPRRMTGALVAQEKGGLVVCTPTNPLTGQPLVYGTRVFRVGPVPNPQVKIMEEL